MSIPRTKHNPNNKCLYEYIMDRQLQVARWSLVVDSNISEEKKCTTNLKNLEV